MSDDTNVKGGLVSDEGYTRITLEGSPTVLIVDDEELMREITRLIVEDNGGQAMTANDGAEAVEIYKKNRDQINYVFMDYSMPNLDGYKAYLAIKEINPAAKIVIASGLNPIDEVKELVVQGEIEFISKPFHEAELIKAFHRLG